MDDATEKELAKQQLDYSAHDSLRLDQSGYDSLKMDQSGFDSLKDELGPSRDNSLRRNEMLDPHFGEQDILKVCFACVRCVCTRNNF